MSHWLRTHRLIPAGLAAAALFAVPLVAFGQDAVETLPRPETSPITRVSDLRADQNGTDPQAGSRGPGADVAKPGAFLFEVALLSTEKLDTTQQSQTSAQFCTGSLIAPDWVLTAAHCLYEDGEPIETRSLTILSGATRLDQGERHGVAEVIIHEAYSEQTLDNDIALLRLSTPAKAATIAVGSDAAMPVVDLAIAGWGRLEDGTFPDDLMASTLQLQPAATCNEGIKSAYAGDLATALRELAGRMRYSDEAVTQATASLQKTMADPLTANMLCSKAAARDACNGDAGAPLIAAGSGTATQVGILSWGEGPFDAEAPCGHANAFGIYTKVANYAGWIQAKMKPKS